MRPLLPGLRCHIVTRLTCGPRSGGEPAQKRLGGREVGDYLCGRTFAGHETDRLAGPDGGLVGPLALVAQLGLTAVPLLRECVAQGPAAVLRRPRDAAADVEHSRVDGVGLARLENGAARSRLVQPLGARQERG